MNKLIVKWLTLQILPKIYSEEKEKALYEAQILYSANLFKFDAAEKNCIRNPQWTNFAGLHMWYILLRYLRR